jgi:PAS domain S-box-containing protein
MDVLHAFLSAPGFMPHGHCFLWTPSLLWGYVLSDGLIALAYFSIPVALWYFVRRRSDLPFSWIFVMFAAFIFACGTTHVLAIWNIWQPVYWLDVGVKMGTALASVLTAVLLWPLMPRALSLTSPRQLAESNRRLEDEIAERRQIERELQELNRSLELRIAERTTQIQATNAELQREIDERREAEDALGRSQQLLQALADNMTSIIWVKDLAGRYLLINGGYEALFKMRREAIVGKTDYELFGKEQADIFRAVDQQAILAKRAVQVEETVFDDARRVTVLSVKCPLYDHQGELYALCGISTDITERKRGEEALAAERTLLRTLIDALPDLVFTKDTAGRFAMCNTAELDHLGLLREEQLIGKTVFDLYPQDLAERYHADDLQVLSGESVTNREEPSRDSAGDPRWHLTIKVPLRDAAGRVTGLVGMSRDITERKRAQDHQSRAQKLEALGTLAGGVAHDFNNILLAITGNAKLAIDDLPGDHPVQEALREISKASARATDLVRRILAFTRAQDPKRKPTQLQPIIEEALQLLRPAMSATININTQFPSSMPAVSADASQIHQILMNLMNNAAYAIGQRSGTIDVRLDTFDVTAETLPLLPDLRVGRYVRLSVSDDGCGMDRETLARIFDPFFTTKPAGEGTGLGLSVVHGIMQSHEGAISVYSAVRKGTVFKLYFPALEQQAATAPAVSGELPRGAGERVLYVDDEHALVLLVTRSLRRLGYVVTGYSDPVQALNAFRLAPADFDVIVTDLSMPGMSGFELARSVLDLRPDVPIVMTSGYLSADDQRTGVQLGLRALILKPNTVDELAEVLSQLFGSRAPERP